MNTSNPVSAPSTSSPKVPVPVSQTAPGQSAQSKPGESFKRILDEIDPMLSKTAQGSAPPPSVATLTTLPPPSSATGQGVDSAQIQNLLHATLQTSPSAQLQQALLSSLTGNPGISANLSQIAAQHQLQQQLQQQLLLNLAGSNSQLSNNLLSAALLGNTGGSSGAAGGIPVSSSPAPSLGNTSGMISSPGNSLDSPPPSGNSSLSTEHLAEDAVKKRDTRLKKNREAARECRRKKKEYVRCLENRVAILESQNQALIGELRALKELYLPKSDA